MNIEALQAALTAAEKQNKSLATQIEQAEQEKQAATADAYARLEKVQEEIAGIEKPFVKRLEALNKAQQEASEAERRAERTYYGTMFKTRIPQTPDERKAMFRAANVLTGTEERSEIARFYGRDEVRAPKLDGHTILAFRDGSWAGSERAYFAWDAENKFVGWLFVRPSRHPGDTTEAEGAVRGVAMFQDHRHSYASIVKPVERWVKALESSK